MAHLKTPCINWHLSLSRDGYGQKWYGGKAKNGGRPYPAHVFVYEQTKGKVPKGLVLDHLCGNRACVNVDHLEPVTQQVNVQRSRTAKLTPSDVLDIRALYSNGKTQISIAREFGVGQDHVSRIVNKARGSWANITV